MLGNQVIFPITNKHIPLRGYMGFKVQKKDIFCNFLNILNEFFYSIFWHMKEHFNKTSVKKY